jgi:hypothetical protein
VAEDGDTAASLRVVFGQERAPERGLGPDHGEEARSDERADDALGLRAAARQVDALRDVGGEPLERTRARAIVFEVRHRDVVARRRRRRLVDEHQPLRLPKRQRLEQHTVDDREDGAVRADPQRQRQHRHDRKPRPLQQRPHPVPHVLQQCHRLTPFAKLGTMNDER